MELFQGYPSPIVDSSSAYEAIYCEGEDCRLQKDVLLAEEALQIKINGEPYTIIMRTPGDELELVAGLLYSEDVYRSNVPFQLGDLEQTEQGFLKSVNVLVDPEHLGDGFLSGRSLLSVSSCGICGKKELKDIQVAGDKLDNLNQINVGRLTNLFLKMRQGQKSFDRTGGCHAAAVFSKNEELIAISEDIGRHNAVDKVVGKLLLSKKIRAANILLVSGRISYEIVTKCFAAKIPILAAVSAPSTLAIDYAKEFGITIFGFCRNGRATCYSNPARLKNYK